MLLSSFILIVPAKTSGFYISYMFIVFSYWSICIIIKCVCVCVLLLLLLQNSILVFISSVLLELSF